MEAFKVWTSLEIKGNALKQMERFAKLTDFANKNVKLLSKEMAGLNQRFFILDARLAKLTPHSEQLLGMLKGLGNSANLNNRAFERYNSQLLRNNEATGLLSDKTALLSDRTLVLDERVKKLSIDANLAAGSLLRMGAASKISTVTGMGGRASAGRAIGQGRHIPFHALSHAGMGGAATGAGALAAMGRFGGPLAIGGLAAGMGLHRGYEANVQYTKQLAQFQSLGFTPDQMADVQQLTTRSTPGVSPLRQIEALRDAQMATRKFSEAKILAPELQKMQFISEAMFTGFSGNQLQNAIRIAEIRGGADPAKIKNELSTVMQMYTTSGGTIDPSKFMPFFKGYQGASRMSREALLALEPTMQEISPVKSATALQTLYGRLMGGIKLTERDESFFEKIGLFKGGKIRGKFANDLSKDPEMFFEKDWLPLLAKQGIISPEGIAQANIHLGRTPSQFFSVMGKNIEKSHRARAQVPGLMNIDQLMGTAFKTESGAALRFMQALESLVVAFGKFSSPMVIAVLNSMASFMEKTSTVLTKAKEFKYVIPTTIHAGGENKVAAWWQSHFGAHTQKMTTPVSNLSEFKNVPMTLPQAKKPPDIHVSLTVDGQKLAKAVAKHQADALVRGGTQSAPNGINPMMTPQPAGVNSFGGFN